MRMRFLILLASIVASGLMFLVLGGPIAGLTTALNNWLSGMTGASAVVPRAAAVS